LIQHQSRIASSSARSSVASPISPLNLDNSTGSFGAFLPGATRGTARPILRRESTTASSDCADEPAEQQHTDDARPTIRHRRSCLKFAVTPRPLQLQPTQSRGGPTSPRLLFDSPATSRRSSKQSEPDELKEEDEEDDNQDAEDDDELQVTTPGFGSDFGESDSDAGYREDSEDGFTSDEEDNMSLGESSRRWRPHLARWTAPPPPILSTSRRRVQMAECPSTTDDGEPGRARTRIRIHDDEERHYARKPTRHRSPPPQIRSAMENARPARPPAARSPSAAEFCRRRTGVARSPCPTSMFRRPPPVTRGWKSDDGSSRRDDQAVDATVKRIDTLQLGLGPRPVVTTETIPAGGSHCVKFQHHERELQELREGRESRERKYRKGSPRRSTSAGAPPRPFRLARRDSAPTMIDEVHVLTSATASACPRRGLKSVLRSHR